MGIFGALVTSVAGMRAQSFALENISGNIANSQTTAFKRVDSSFLDLIPEGTPGRQLAGSVTSSSRLTNTVQGEVQAASISTFMVINGEGFLFIPAEPDLIEYANRVAQEIPEGIQIKVVTIHNQEKDINISIASDQITSSAPIASERIILRVDQKSNCEAGKVTSLPKNEGSVLAKSYESSINIFGKFKQEIMSLPRFAS